MVWANGRGQSKPFLAVPCPSDSSRSISSRLFITCRSYKYPTPRVKYFLVLSLFDQTRPFLGLLSNYPASRPRGGGDSFAGPTQTRKLRTASLDLSRSNARMAAETVDPPILSSPDPLTDPQTPVVDHNSPSLDLQTAQTGPATTRRESRIAENDPSAYKITILLASSGYRTQISINRSFLEKASLVGGDGFLVGQLKNAIWKDWPSGGPFILDRAYFYRLAGRIAVESKLSSIDIWREDVG